MYNQQALNTKDKKNTDIPKIQKIKKRLPHEE